MKLDRTQRGRLERAGQAFLADHFDGLAPAAQAHLLEQIEALDLDALAALRAGEGLAAPREGAWEALPYVPAGERGADTPAARRGLAALKAGRVGFVVLAGGQASRLQWDGPKGTFAIGPASDRSLFQILVEQVLRAQREHHPGLPLAVTTSATTDAAIRAFFELHDCFGLDRETLRFACQESLPALDEEGRLILSAPDRIFLSPDGHGGAVRALETAGILEEWERRGVDTVCTCQVDNPLLRVVDPDFFGRVETGGAPLATKVILKEKPEEKLGVVVSVGRRPAIVEYSELPAEHAAARDEDGQLTYRLGSIAVHALRLDFLRDALREPLPLHAARKQIPCLDAGGTVRRCWGVKYERFLFDLFPRAPALSVVEVSREREYAPVKNAEGAESPAAVRAALDREYRRWYRAAGRTPPNDHPIEISPLDATGPDDLRR